MVWFKKYAIDLEIKNCGLNSVWTSHVQSGSGAFSKCVKITWQDQLVQKWFSRISVEENFSSYKNYKYVHEFEEYADILPEYPKHSLLDFRTGSQKLHVKLYIQIINTKARAHLHLVQKKTSQ